MPIDPLIGYGKVQSRSELVSRRMPSTWLAGGIVFETADWLSDETELEWAADHHLVILTNTGSTKFTRVRGEGTMCFEGRDSAASLSFVPAKLSRKCTYEAADLNYSALWFKPELLEAWQLPFRPARLTINGSDAVIHAVVAALRDEIAAGHCPDAAYVEQAVRLVAARLACIEGHRPSAAGKLSRRMLTAVDDYVVDNLRRNISLSDLAGVTGIPVDTFSRRFKATTGQTPYAWILELRVRALADRLRQQNANLAGLSVQLGFSSQSHMTNTFRRLRGVTPSRYRQDFFPVS